MVIEKYYNCSSAVAFYVQMFIIIIIMWFQYQKYKFYHVIFYNQEFHWNLRVKIIFNYFKIT